MEPLPILFQLKVMAIPMIIGIVPQPKRGHCKNVPKHLEAETVK
jgi:hypothetical protein